MSLDTSHVFKSYSNSCSAPSDVTINLKDLKALVGLCVELGADVVLKFDEAGVPVLAVPHAPGVQVRKEGGGEGREGREGGKGGRVAALRGSGVEWMVLLG